MPGNAEEGMLEDLCLHTIANHPVLSCVEMYISCLRELLEHERECAKKSGKILFPEKCGKGKNAYF